MNTFYFLFDLRLTSSIHNLILNHLNNFALST